MRKNPALHSGKRPLPAQSQLYFYIKSKKTLREDSTATHRLKRKSLRQMPGHITGLHTQKEKTLENKTHIYEHQVTCQLLP